MKFETAKKEIERRFGTQKKCSEKLKMNYITLNRKLNGFIGMTIDDMVAIAKICNSNTHDLFFKEIDEKYFSKK